MTTTSPVHVPTITLAKASKFIESLAQEEKETALAMIKSLESPPYEGNLVKLIDKEARIYEVRGSTKDFWIRLFWFYHKIPHENRTVIVITNGYAKQQTKTDKTEIKTAKQIKSLYESLKRDEYKSLKKKK